MQVQITIRGRRYTVRGDDSGEDIQELAAELDRRMEEVARRTRSFDEYTVAMLTALNLLSEMARLRLATASRLDELDRDVTSIAAMLEAALPPDGGEADGGAEGSPAPQSEPGGAADPSTEDGTE
ncbi:MAG: cell division protein ZapA [Deltaproteobacteria bacterium]|nr:MAG: cell division protein ZapA [Deltaproteobacteria bacterium]